MLTHPKLGFYWVHNVFHRASQQNGIDRAKWKTYGHQHLGGVHGVWIFSFGQTELLTKGYSPHAGWKITELRIGTDLKHLTVWKGCEAFRGTSIGRAVRKRVCFFWPSSLTLLDGRAGTTRWIALHCLQMFVVATACTQRQTHAVTFRLCSSIVVAVFVTFWNYVFGFFGVFIFFNGSQAVTEESSGGTFIFWHQPPEVKAHPITIH